MDVRRALRGVDRRVLPELGGLLRVGRHRRHRPMLGGAVLLTSMGLIAAVAWIATAQPAPPAHTDARVGVRAGESVPAYVEQARRALTGLSASTPADRSVWALVSFTGYLVPARLGPTLAAVDVDRVYTRVPQSRMTGPVAEFSAHRVPADVTAGMDRLAADRYRIAEDFGRLADQAGTAPAQHTQYLSERAAYQAEATGYHQHCRCVFAAVVRGTPTELLRLADRPSVRAVDPAAQLRSLSGAVFTPPLPEQTGAAVPPDAQSPTASPTVSDRHGAPGTTTSPTASSTPADPSGPAAPSSSPPGSATPAPTVGPAVTGTPSGASTVSPG